MKAEQIAFDFGWRPGRHAAAGTHHDLLDIHAQLNARHFAGQIAARITWGRMPSGSDQRAWRRSIKLGSYAPAQGLIRVHPALDAAFVPRFFVEYIVYHEMLHELLPPVARARRRELHGPEFKRLERMFPHYEQALRWERRHIHRLLGR